MTPKTQQLIDRVREIDSFADSLRDKPDEWWMLLPPEQLKEHHDAADELRNAAPLLARALEIAVKELKDFAFLEAIEFYEGGATVALKEIESLIGEGEK